jgi:hypothetical protein
MIFKTKHKEFTHKKYRLERDLQQTAQYVYSIAFLVNVAEATLAKQADL